MIALFLDEFKHKNSCEIKTIYYKLMANVESLNIACYCGCNALKYFSTYSRSFPNEVNHEDTITITRVYCTSCNATHAILPYPIVPYKQHTSIIISKTLLYKEQNSVNKASTVFNTPRSTIYNWNKSLMSCISLLITLFKQYDEEKSNMTPLKTLTKYSENMYEISQKYFFEYKKIFLRSAFT